MGQFSRMNTRVVVLASAGLLVAVAILLLCVPVVRINKKACDQIRPGITLPEAEEIIGGPPKWYDGVWGIRTDSPGYKGYRPFWVGSQGEIIVELDEQGRVSNARFYPGEVLNRSVSAFVWERWTRNGFGTGRTDLVVEGIDGVCFGLLLAMPLVMIALLLRSSGWKSCAYGLCVLGAMFSLAFIILAIGVGASTMRHPSFWPLGAGASGLGLFVLGSILAGRRKTRMAKSSAGGEAGAGPNGVK